MCSITEQCTIFSVLLVLKHSQIKNDIIESLFSDNAWLAKWEITNTMS